MDNDTESNAQDPNLPDGENNEGADNAAKEQAEGFQKRIDELTARAGEAERKFAEAQQQQIALLTNQATQRQPTEVVDPYPDMDPSVKKLLQETTGAMRREFGNQIAQIRASHESELMARDAASIANSIGGDESIQREAAELARNLRAKGVPINAKDAAIFALGTAVAEGRYKPGGQTRQVQGAPAVIGATRAAPIQQQTSQALPANFDDLDPDTQLAVLNKRGAGNIPI